MNPCEKYLCVNITTLLLKLLCRRYNAYSNKKYSLKNVVSKIQWKTIFIMPYDMIFLRKVVNMLFKNVINTLFKNVVRQRNFLTSSPCGDWAANNKSLFIMLMVFLYKISSHLTAWYSLVKLWISFFLKRMLRVSATSSLLVPAAIE